MKRYSVICIQDQAWKVLRHMDHDKRLSFAHTFLARMDMDVAWPLKFLWEGKTFCFLNECANAQNTRIWIRIHQI